MYAKNNVFLSFTVLISPPHLPHPTHQSIIKLLKLAVLDVTKNRLELLPDGFAKLTSLSDLHLSENCLQELPADLGNLTNLTLLKADVNQIMALPDSIGR